MGAAWSPSKENKWKRWAAGKESSDAVLAKVFAPPLSFFGTESLSAATDILTGNLLPLNLFVDKHVGGGLF